MLTAYGDKIRHYWKVKKHFLPVLHDFKVHIFQQIRYRRLILSNVLIAIWLLTKMQLKSWHEVPCQILDSLDLSCVKMWAFINNLANPVKATYFFNRLSMSERRPLWSAHLIHLVHAINISSSKSCVWKIVVFFFFFSVVEQLPEDPAERSPTFHEMLLV